MARTWTGHNTIGITLQYSTNGTAWVDVEGLQNIPDVGGNKESIETTCLDNEGHTYIAGLKAVPESLDFTLLHDKDNFNTLNGLTSEYTWKISLPDDTDGALGTYATWKGTCSIKMNGAGIGEAITDTLSVKPSTDIVFNRAI